MIPALQLLVTQDTPDVRIVERICRSNTASLIISTDEVPVAKLGRIRNLATAAILLSRQLAARPAGRMWLRIVVWAGAFALVGLAAGWGKRPEKSLPQYLQSLPLYDERTFLLKFYPFRLFDVLVPLTVSIECTALICRRQTLAWRTKLETSVLMICVTLAMIAAAFIRNSNFISRRSSIRRVGRCLSVGATSHSAERTRTSAGA